MRAVTSGPGCHGHTGGGARVRETDGRRTIRHPNLDDDVNSNRVGYANRDSYPHPDTDRYPNSHSDIHTLSDSNPDGY